MIPKHVAIIMDGNGRWAKDKGLPREYGHQNGVNSVKSIVEEAYKSGIQYLTLYAFSIENWDRPSDEINILMSLLVSTLRDEFDEIFDNDIKLNAIGEIKSLPKELVSELDFIINKTRKNTKMTLTLALSYGGKQEIFNAIKIISNKVKNNLIELNNFDDSIINSHLYTKNLPDVDLLIRTSGEQRISNFLLWQIAYTEIFFVDKMWPEFNNNDFHNEIIKLKIKKDDLIFIICRSGSRSLSAAQYLTTLNYKKCINVCDGFEGRKDYNFHRSKINGWKFNQLPWKQ